MTLELRILAYAVVVIFAGLGLYLIFTLRKISNMLDVTEKNIKDLSVNLSGNLNKMTDDISELKDKVIESLDGVDNLTDQLVESTKSIDGQVNRLFNTLEPAEVLIKTVVHKIFPPVNQLASLITASSKALNAFLGVLTKKK